ncbi:hypothetical protein BGZ51_000827, partial [Haplosporangium sp. Z 767]
QWIVEVVSEETFEEIEEVEEIVEEEVAKEIIAHQEETTVQEIPATTTTETTTEIITTTEEEHVDVVVPKVAVTEGRPVEVKEEIKESQVEKIIVPCEEVDVHETTTTEVITETTTTESTTEIITTTEEEHVDVVVPKVAVIEGCPIDVKEEIKESEIEKVIAPCEVVDVHETSTTEVITETITAETTTESTTEIIAVTEDEHVDVVVPKVAVIEGRPVDVKEETKESQVEKVIVPCEEVDVHETTTTEVITETTTTETTTESTTEIITTTEDEHVDVVVPKTAVIEGCPIDVKEDTKESQIEKVIVPCEEVDVHETTTTEVITETTTTESTTEIITTTEEEHVDVVVPKLAVTEGCPIEVKEEIKESQIEKVNVPCEEVDVHETTVAE